MLEFKLNPWNAKIIEQQEEVVSGIKRQLEALLRDGGRITPDGKVVDGNDPQADVFTLAPKTNNNLGYWFDRGKINIVAGDENFKPIDAFANYAKSALKEGDLYNHRIKTRRLVSLMLVEIADKEGVGKIKNPKIDRLSAA